jgi:transcriptional regulator with XRE-family HTH domain
MKRTQSVKPASISTQFRKIIERSGVSRYRICKEIGLSESAMSRFMARKGGLSLATFDRLGQVLCLRIEADMESARKGKLFNRGNAAACAPELRAFLAELPSMEDLAATLPSVADLNDDLH